LTGIKKGIPKILRAIQKNGSPLPVLETDEERIYFVARFSDPSGGGEKSVEGSRHPCHKRWSNRRWHQVGTKLGIEESLIEKLLQMCAEPQKIKDLMEALSNRTRTGKG